MRRFNPEKELYKIQHGNRNKVIIGVVALLIIIGISSSYALYQVRYSKRIIYTKVAPFSNSDINLAVLIDGTPADDFPEKDKGKIYDKIDCGETNVKAYWDYDKWELVLETSKKAKCTVYFKTGSSSSETKPDTSGANAPELYQGLIPIKYDEDGTIRVADPKATDWYNYDEKRWANAVLIGNKGFAADLSGNGNNGVLIGDAKITDEGLQLDGSEDAIFLSNQLKDIYKQSNTIQFKLKMSEKNARDIVMGNYDSSLKPSINYEIYSNNQTRIYWYGSAEADNTSISAPFTTDLTTITFVYNREEGKFNVYYGSDMVYEVKSDLYKNDIIDYVNVYIGRDAREGTTAFKGTIEKVMIYKDILEQDEIEHNINITTSGKIDGDGVIKDNLFLYYDFKVEQPVDLIDTSPGAILDEGLISQMYVWIPRYKYQLFNTYNGSTSDQMINIKFEQGTNSMGNVSCNTDEKGGQTCDNAFNGNWYTHPAFTFGDTELTGIWIGKFEASDSTTYLSIKPNVISWKNINISTMFDAARNIERKSANMFNLKIEQIDTHMMKNSEWGAMAYLTHSKYGRCDKNAKCEEVLINDREDHLTGYANTIDYWNTANGQKASTTGNIYGIYDTVGNSWEYVMGVTMKDINASSIGYADSGFNDDNMPESKYYNLYEYGTSFTDHQRGHLGDAVRETLQTFGAEYGGWYGDWTYFPSTTATWYCRGGDENDSSRTGSFAYYGFPGNALGDVSFRVVITAQDGVDKVIEES